MVTTTLFVAAARRDPSYSATPLRVSDAEPCTLPPPCTKKSTGSALDGVALDGAHTLSVRQSSAPITFVGSAASSCRHSAPKVVAASGADQQAGGCGACQRSAPTGGAAYGMAK